MKICAFVSSFSEICHAIEGAGELEKLEDEGIEVKIEEKIDAEVQEFE